MLDGKRTQRFFRTKSDAHAWMSSLHQGLTDQFWQGLTVQERQLIMITHQNGISSPAPRLTQGELMMRFMRFWKSNSIST